MTASAGQLFLSTFQSPVNVLYAPSGHWPGSTSRLWSARVIQDSRDEPAATAWRQTGSALIYGQNEAALAAGRTFPNGIVDRLTCGGALKTAALKATLDGTGRRYRFNAATKTYERDMRTDPFTGVIVGARSDEEGSRSKERYFSPRDEHHTWDVAEQPPEFWNQFKRNSDQARTSGSTRSWIGRN